MRSLVYSWYTVLVLMVTYLLSYVDRSILSLLVVPIRSDLQLSDTQVSLLHGFAFALLYATLGFPVGRLADRKNRVGIIVAGIGLWSLFTVACGLAKNFGQMFFARVGVGIGEAALNPCAYSIIADSFPRRLLSRALSTYVMGTYMGFGAAFIIGGIVVGGITASPTMELPLVGEIYSWQAAFFYVGLPGLLVMALVGGTLKEPERKGVLGVGSKTRGVPLGVLWDFLVLNRWTIISHLTGFAFIGILVNGLVLWTPTFFHRTYDWAVADVGVLYGFVLLGFGPLGIFFGGWLADYIDRGLIRGGAYMAAAGLVALGIVPAIASPLMPNPWLSLALIAWLVFCTSAPWGIAVSALKQITPNEMRGQISAVYLFFVNIIGIGFGPTLIAVVTDYGFAEDSALRYSMSLVGGVAAIFGVLALTLGLPHFRQSLQRAEQWESAREEASR